MTGKVTKDTPHGAVELRGSDDALAYAMVAIGAHTGLVQALDRLHIAVTMRPSGNGGLSPSERVALDAARAALTSVQS